MNWDEAVLGEGFTGEGPGSRDGIGIGVDCEDASDWRLVFQKRARMAAAAEGGVDVGAVPTRREGRNRLLEENGAMPWRMRFRSQRWRSGRL